MCCNRKIINEKVVWPGVITTPNCIITYTQVSPSDLFLLHHKHLPSITTWMYLMPEASSIYTWNIHKTRQFLLSFM